MPETDVLLFAEEDGSAPLLAWLDDLPAKVRDKCIVRIERLAQLGHELRRPEADLLRACVTRVFTTGCSISFTSGAQWLRTG